MREIKFREFTGLGVRYWGSINGEFVPPWNDEGWEQFTGQLDKNGKEIYEGDILSGPYERRTVEWNKNDGRWNMRAGNNGYPFYSEWTGQHKVIGNIHENEKESIK